MTHGALADLPVAAAAAPGALLRVELLVPALPAAGMEVMVAALARSLRDRGHAVGVTCTDGLGPLADVLVAAGMRVSLVPARGFVSSFRAPELAAHLAQIAPDVVHAHSGVWSRAVAAASAARVRAVVATEHGLPEEDTWLTPALMRWSARSTAHVVAVSEALQGYLTRRVRLRPERVSVIVNGIDTDRYAPGPRDPGVRARLGVAAGRRVVGIVARFTPVKNHAFLLRAFAEVAAARPDVDLALVGAGPLQDDLQRMVAELGLAGRVLFPGLTADTAPVYREFDAFVLSSLSEGTSMSVLEAMASRLPIVATAVGGTPHLLDGGACGRLVPSNDVPALRAALLAVLDDAGASQAMADRARARVVEAFSHDRMVDRYEQLYRALVGARRPR